MKNSVYDNKLSVCQTKSSVGGNITGTFADDILCIISLSYAGL